MNEISTISYGIFIPVFLSLGIESHARLLDILFVSNLAGVIPCVKWQ
jgi:hypothetical protein